MPGRLLLQSVVILWLVQAAHTRGYGAGVANGQGPQHNGNKPQNGGGVGRMLMPSKGVGQAMGAQNGYNGYPTKGLGYGAQAGPTNGQQMKGNGYGAHAGGYSRQGTKGYNAAAGVPAGNAAKPNGKGGVAATHNGHGTKGNGYGAGTGVPNGNGQGAAAGPSNGNGARPNGQGAAGSKPMKGYGRPHYGAGVGMGAPRVGVPQLARNKAYGSNGYNGNGAQPMGGYNGGYGGAGLGMGHRYGNGGMKGPKHGYGAAAGVHGQAAKPHGYAGARVPNGNGAVPNGYGYPNGGATKQAKPGYGNVPNGYGAKPNGYGATRGGAMRPQPGYGNGAVPNGYGAKPISHGVRNGAALGGYGGQPNGYGGPSRGSKPQTTKGFGAVSPSEGAKTLDTGYGGPAGGPNGQSGTAANTGYNMMPNGKGAKGAGVSDQKGLKGGVLPAEQPSATPEEYVASPQAITQGAAPVAPEPTSGIVVMVTQEKYQKLPSPVPQGKTYKQTPQATPKPAPAIPQGKGQKLAPEPTPEAALVGKGPKAATSGPAPAVPQTNPAPEPEAVVPQGYVTGSAVPEQKGAEADALFGVDGTSEGDAVPESTKPLKTKAVPETVTAKSNGGITPEAALAVGLPEVAPEEASIKSQPEAGPRVHGLPAGDTGATENGGGVSISKGQGTKAAKPDCGPSGVPNGQWMKIPRPGYNAGTGASAGTNTKGYGAGAGVPQRFGAKPNGHGARVGVYSNAGGTKENKPGYGGGGGGGYTAPGRNFGFGPRYPHAGKPKQPGYGQGAYLGAGNGNSYGGNGGLGEAGNGNGYSAGIQPDYASLGQGVPTANGKSGGARQMPYNGAPMIPVGLDGMSQFEPQTAGLGPNGKLGSMYGGMRGLPFGSQSLGVAAEKSNTKYGIGGLQFGGQPFSTGTNGAGNYGYGGSPYGPAGGGKSSGKYGGVGTSMGGDPAPATAQYGYGGFPNSGQLLGLDSNGNTPGKYGYGRMPYEAQPAGLTPEAKSTGQYAPAGSPHQPEPLGFGQTGKLTGKYGAGEVPYAPQALGFGSEAKSFGKYDNQGPYLSQPLESASEGRSDGEYDVAGVPYEALPLEPDSAGKSYVNGDVPTPAVEGDRYENVGYINGQVQPEVVAFPAAPTPGPTLVYPSVPSYLPVESFTPDVVPGAGVEDLADPEGTAGLAFDSAPAPEMQGVAQVPEQPDDLLHHQQLPRQIHIQQHLKLHFHPQGAKNGKYDLNGFFGNSG